MSRGTAATIVGRVMRSGAYSNVLVQMETKDLDSLDAKHIQFLVFGTLRHLSRIDEVIAGYSKRHRIDPDVLDVLRVGTFELLETDTPAHASVNAAVEAAAEVAGPKVKGFVNGVLRSIERFGDPDAGPLVNRSGIDPEILKSLTDAWGEERVSAFVTASFEPASVVGRLRNPALAHNGQPVDGVADAFLLDGTARFEDWAVQDASSIVVGSVVPIGGSGPILDMAAAPGGKSLHLFDRLGSADRLVLADAHAKRIGRAQKRLRQSGCVATWIRADGRKGPFATGTFDAVLLDAPCTGLGTLRRRPEIKHRIKQSDVLRMAGIQRLMLQEAVRVTKPGGTVIYSVCTVTPEETIEQVEPWAGRPPEDAPGHIWGGGTLLTPDRTGTDGMFISCIDVTQ